MCRIAESQKPRHQVPQSILTKLWWDYEKCPDLTEKRRRNKFTLLGWSVVDETRIDESWSDEKQQSTGKRWFTGLAFDLLVCILKPATIL